MEDRIAAGVAIDANPSRGRRAKTCTSRWLGYYEGGRDGLVGAGRGVINGTRPVRAVLRVGMVGGTRNFSVGVEDGVLGTGVKSTVLATLVSLLEGGASENGRGEKNVGEEGGDEHV